MKDSSLRENFAKCDVGENGKGKGRGWSQNFTLRDGKVEVDCIQMLAIIPGQTMKRHIAAANQATLVDYIDTGFVLHEYVAKLPFEAVLTRLLNVRETPVHLAAPELLSGLSKDGWLTQFFTP